MSQDQRIDQSAMSIKGLLNTNGATFLMTRKIGPLDFTRNYYEISDLGLDLYLDMFDQN